MPVGQVHYIPTYTYERDSSHPELIRNHQTAITLYKNSTLFESLNQRLGGLNQEITLGTWSALDPKTNKFQAANLVIGGNVFNSAMRVYYGNYDNNDAVNLVKDELNSLGVNYTSLFVDYVQSTSPIRVRETKGLNEFIYTDPTFLGEVGNNGLTLSANNVVGGTATGAMAFYSVHIDKRISPGPGESYHNSFKIQTVIFPDDVLEGNIDQNTLAYETAGKFPINVDFEGSYNQQTGKWSGSLKVSTPGSATASSNAFMTIRSKFGGDHPYNENGVTGELDLTPDENNPYGLPGISGPGGGDGTYNDPDVTDPTEIPGLPDIGATDLGFITMYNPTAAQIKALSEFMWSNAFDLATWKKLFSDPMQSIIGLAIVPIMPDLSGAKTVKFGSIDSEIAMNTIASQYKQLDCGWCDIDKWIGSFMDYSPYTKISIYLPYIGIRTLSADDIMGGSIHVVYNVDLLTGSCAAFVEHSYRGVLYSYNGSCITNIPLTAQNFSGAIQNAVSAVISAAGMAAGMVTGAAPLTAMSAAGLLNSAANTALNSKPEIQRSGNLGGSAGILSVQRPYLIIERPNISVPGNMAHYIGQTSNITAKLGNLSGFTVVDYIHLHDVPATNEELAEIESLLKKGVIL